MLTLFLSACTKPYVGTKVNYYGPSFCRGIELPKTCITDTPDFTFDFKISKGDAPGEYAIEERLLIKAKSADGTQNSKFYLLLAKNGEIIDCLSLTLTGTDLDHRIPFKKTFTSQDFVAVDITYQVVVS